MKNRILFTVVLISLSNLIFASNAVITIPPHQRFLLGELETTSFKVKIKNLSKFPIQIETKNSRGLRTSSFTFAPKGETKLGVEKNEHVLLINTTDESIKIAAHISKSVEGMRYETVDKIQVEDAASVKDKDLEVLISDQWKGELTYIDYTSGKRTSIASEMKIARQKKDSYIFEYIYTYEPNKSNKMKVKIQEEGTILNDQKVTSVQQEGEYLVIKTEKQGKDNGKKVWFVFTYRFNEKMLSMKKEYRLLGSDELNFRNEYVFRK